MDRQSDRLPRQTRCEGMRIKREIQMGASRGGQSIKASGIAARTGRTQTCNRHDSPKPKMPLTRGGRPHNSPPGKSLQTIGSSAVSRLRGAGAFVLGKLSTREFAAEAPPAVSAVGEAALAAYQAPWFPSVQPRAPAR